MYSILWPEFFFFFFYSFFRLRFAIFADFLLRHAFFFLCFVFVWFLLLDKGLQSPILHEAKYEEI